MKRTPVDTHVYTVVCAGVRHGPMPKARAIELAEAIVTEWAQYGYRRTAQVYFRDGSLHAEIGRKL
jgi:hypothetical protein